MDKRDWYVAIMRAGDGYYPFIAAGCEGYREWKAASSRGGVMHVAAEAFCLSDEEVNLLTGFNAQGTRIAEEGELAKLGKMLSGKRRAGQVTTPQADLNRLLESLGKQ